MTRAPEGFTYSATAGVVMLATTVAVALIVYAVLTFVALVPTGPAQALVQLAY